METFSYDLWNHVDQCNWNYMKYTAQSLKYQHLQAKDAFISHIRKQICVP